MTPTVTYCPLFKEYAELHERCLRTPHTSDQAHRLYALVGPLEPCPNPLCEDGEIRNSYGQGNDGTMYVGTCSVCGGSAHKDPFAELRAAANPPEIDLRLSGGAAWTAGFDAALDAVLEAIGGRA